MQRDKDAGSMEFKITEQLGQRFLQVTSARLNECVDYWLRNREFGIHLSRYHGFAEEGLQVIERFPGITALFIQDQYADCSPLYSASRLNCLIAGELLPIDLSRFDRLSVYRGDWHRGLSLSSCRSLTHLALWGFAPRSRDCDEIATLTSLRFLELVRPRIESLWGLDSLCRLQSLAIHLARSLSDLSALSESMNQLSYLELNSCPKVSDYAQLSRLHALKKMIISNCKALPSLEFINELVFLEFFSFVQTDVLDNQLGPLLRHPTLKRVGFTDSKRFSHSMDEVNALLER